MPKEQEAALLPTRRSVLGGTFAGVVGTLARMRVAQAAPAPAPHDAGVMAQENAADRSLSAFVWYRNDRPRAISETYWRDVHGVMVVRVPGVWRYRQLRFGRNRADLWPTTRAIAFDVPEAAQPHGIPHLLFRSEADLKVFSGHPTIQRLIFNDERNFVGRVGNQISPPGGARTLIDRVDESETQGAPRLPTFALCLAPSDGLESVAAFHRHLVERIARPWSTRPGVMRLRVQPLDRYDADAWTSPGVLHDWPSARSYLGWIEIAVADDSVLRTLMTSAEAAEHARFVGAIHTYPVPEIYTMVANGRPTEVGLRGYPAVRTIIAAGAGNQRAPEALSAVYGDSAH